MSNVGAIRKRLKRQELPGGTRFVTFSCEQRLPLFRNPKIADVFVDAMSVAKRKFGFGLIAWVVMPEHVHLLVRAGEHAPLGRALLSIKLSVAQRVIARWKELDAPILKRITGPDRKPRFWLKGGGFDRNVRGDRALAKDIQYIHRNPVERELVSSPEHWQWSSVRWWMEQREGEVECQFPAGEGWDRWRGFM